MSPSLARLVPDAAIYLSGAEAESLGVEPGTLVTVASDEGEVTLPLAIDNSLGEGTVYVPANLEETVALGASVSVTVTAGGEA